MRTLVDVAEAQVRLAELVEKARMGAEIVIARNGAAVARLVGIAAESDADRVPGSARGLFVVPADFDAPIADFAEPGG